MIIWNIDGPWTLHTIMSYARDCIGTTHPEQVTIAFGIMFAEITPVVQVRDSKSRKRLYKAELR